MLANDIGFVKVQYPRTCRLPANLASMESIARVGRNMQRAAIARVIGTRGGGSRGGGPRCGLKERR